MKRSVFKARVDARGHGSIFIDDKDISHCVTGFRAEADVDGVTKVRVELIAMELDVDLEAETETVARTEGETP